MRMPTADEVFTEAYWQPLAELPEPETRGIIPPFRARDQIDALTTAAALAIFRGESRQPIPQGTELNYEPTNEFIQPGVVLLVDSETLGPVPGHGDEECGDRLPRHRSDYMWTPGEVVNPPVGLFRINSQRRDILGKPHPPTVFPYRKVLCNPALGMHYTRAVQLVVVGYDRKGEVAEPRAQEAWNVGNSYEEVSGMFRLRDIFKLSQRRLVLPRTVGQAYEVDDDHTDFIAYRIRSAELCLRGHLSYATARKRLALPRLRTEPAEPNPQPI